MRIPIAKESLARSLILSGTTTRNVGRLAGINRMTAWKLSKQVIAEHGPIYCACGRISGHRGWCSPRLARSPGCAGWVLSHIRDINAKRRRRTMVSLDTGGYYFIPSEVLSPLEILLQKESENL